MSFTSSSTLNKILNLLPKIYLKIKLVLVNQPEDVVGEKAFYLNPYPHPLPNHFNHHHSTFNDIYLFDINKGVLNVLSAIH